MINEDKKEIMDCHAALAMTFPCHTELVSGSHNFAPSPLVGEGWGEGLKSNNSGLPRRLRSVLNFLHATQSRAFSPFGLIRPRCSAIRTRCTPSVRKFASQWRKFFLSYPHLSYFQVSSFFLNYCLNSCTKI